MHVGRYTYTFLFGKQIHWLLQGMQWLPAASQPCFIVYSKSSGPITKPMQHTLCIYSLRMYIVFCIENRNIYIQNWYFLFRAFYLDYKTPRTKYNFPFTYYNICTVSWVHVQGCVCIFQYVFNILLSKVFALFLLFICSVSSVSMVRCIFVSSDDGW